MDVIDIIIAYNPLFSPDRENVIMVPVEYVEKVKELAQLYNAQIQIFHKMKSKYVYIRWYYSPDGESDE
ncbi:MAG: hypothetical protein JHC26_00605 [Thermofilum sp.]|uniref:hypothetical protein n=1 Tax=Thermofilum sp. TaxID=1961369 RepID=UPI00258EF08C|nr:hypothetical protein [Thermofilum sp.]MCI4407566.1 hypothetical protein [Thermofilum sp.]